MKNTTNNTTKFIMIAVSVLVCMCTVLGCAVTLDDPDPSKTDATNGKTTENTPPASTAATTGPASSTTGHAQTTAPAPATTVPSQTTISAPATTIPVQTTAPAPATTVHVQTTAPAPATTVPPQTTAPAPATTAPPAVTYPFMDSPDYSGSPAYLPETPDAGEEYLKKLVFLGDSRTYGLRYYGVLPEGKETKQVWTPAVGYLTLSYVNDVKILYPETGEEITVKEAARRKQPEYLVVALGINGISFMNEKSFKGTFDVLIKNIREVSPNTKIILQSMYPLATSYETSSTRNNSTIIRANTWMIECAEANNVKFLDSYDLLADSNGYLSDKYQSGDGLHINVPGYKRIIHFFRTHAWQ